MLCLCEPVCAYRCVGARAYVNVCVRAYVRTCPFLSLRVCACAHVRIVLLTRKPRELRLIYTRNTLTYVTFIFVCKTANVQVIANTRNTNISFTHSRLHRLLSGRSNFIYLRHSVAAKAVRACIGYRYSDWLAQKTTQIPYVRYLFWFTKLAATNMFRYILFEKLFSNVTIRGMNNTLL